MIEELQSKNAACVTDSSIPGSPSNPLIESLMCRLREVPDNPELLNDLGVALIRAGCVEEGVAQFQAALKIASHRDQTYRNLAKVYLDSARLDEAEMILLKLVELQVASARDYCTLGRTRRSLGRIETAVAAFEKAVALAPEWPEAYHELAMGLVDLKKLADAKRAYKKALELQPDYPEAWNNLGVLCQEQGQLDEAVDSLQRAIRLRPSFAGGYNNLGVALAEQRKFDEALNCYHQALAIDPDYTVGWNNLGNALRHLGQYQEAVTALERAIRLKPDYAEARNNIAITHLQMGRINSALENYNQAIFLRPDYSEAHMNRGLCWLALGDFEKGWADYEWRWSLKTVNRRHYPGRRWDGGPLAGKRLLLHYEQGLGDTFQFIRYAPELKERGATVIFEGQSPTRQILSRTPGIDEFVPRGTKVPPFDCYCALLSLPGLCKTRMENIPSPIPYIFSDSNLATAWRPRLEALEGFSVGVAWQGNPEHRGDRQRSIPLRSFAPLAQVDGVRMISLQRGFGSEQIQKLQRLFDLTTFAGIDEGADGFLRTAAIIQNLDLVISADTAVAHLAGAMGIPVWVMLPFAPDWRWLQERDDSPWYPTMRLFRQREAGNWLEVFERVAVALDGRVRGAGSRTTSVSQEQRQQADERVRDGCHWLTQNNMANAEQALQEALRLDPNSADGHHDMGILLAKQRRFEPAIASLRRALELRPVSAMTYANLGLAFLQHGQIDESVSHLRNAIRLGGGTPDVYNNLGVALASIPDRSAAASAYLDALQLRPDYAEAHYNLSRALLAQGKMEQGWIEYEWRWKCLPEKPRRYKQPRWTGDHLPDKTILLYAEQGLGDAIQFVRYVAMVKRRVGHVIVECQSPLAALFSRHSAINQVVERGKALPAFDVHAPLMSLPTILGTTQETIPSCTSYLAPGPELIEHWQDRLKNVAGVKVGIAWQGNPNHGADRERSIPLQRFEPLAKIEGVRLVSLQRQFGMEQVANVRGLFEVVETALPDEEVDGFLSTAALIANLNLVITADSAIAHLAGALGVSVWVALPLASEWRWLEGREDSPWYPTMRLFRQQRRGDWDEVFRRMAGELQSRAAALAPSPVSYGTIGGAAAKAAHEEGRRHYDRGYLAEAAECFERTLREDSNYAAAHHDLGVVRARQRRLDMAIEHFRCALEIDPSMSCVYGNLVLALLNKRDFASAVAEAQRGVSLSPANPELHYRLGVALSAQKLYGESVRSLQRAIDLRPDYVDAYLSLGTAQRWNGDATAAAESYQRVIELRPEVAEAYYELGVCRAASGELERSIACYEEAIKRRPQYSDALEHYGIALLKLDRVAEAVEAFQRAVYLEPKNVRMHTDLAAALLTAGRLEQGWLEYEWRWKAANVKQRKLPGIRWDGVALQGKSLLLTVEQGMPEMLQFVRYAKLAKDRGAKVSLECQPGLTSLLAQCPYLDRVISAGDALPPCEFHCPLLSLPAIFGNHFSDLSTGIPYVYSDPFLVERWSRLRSSGDRKRIGIAWRRESAWDDKHETVPVDVFMPMSVLTGAELISLERTNEADRPEPFGSSVRWLEELEQGAGVWMNLAAVITHLDVVVTADNTIAHLAGALGIPVLVILEADSHWRWMKNRNDSPWYPNMRLIRKQRGGTWSCVTQEIMRQLRNCFAEM